MVRRIIRDADGATISDETLTDESVGYVHSTIVHTVGVDHFTIVRDDGSSIEYRRGPELGMDELDLSPQELMREHGVKVVTDDWGSR